MAIDSLSLAPARHARFRSRIATLPPVAWLAGFIVLSVGLRIAAALGHATPRYFPDEYIYSSLSRSLAQGKLEIRGTPAHFPALLEPLLAAPLWLGDNIELSYRLTQSLHALAASLAAVPVYLLAGRLGLPAWQRLACALLTLASPPLVYASYLTADAVALPLALAAVLAGSAALSEPTRSRQVWFIVFLGLACFARVQYVALLPAFAVAALVLTRGRPWDAVRRYPLIAGLLAAPVLLAFAAGPGRLLGYYESVLDLSLRPTAMAQWAATDMAMLAYAAGWVLVPLAVVGLVSACARPATPREHAFGVLTASLLAFLLLEASLYATNGSARFQERYLIALLPLVPLLACLGARRLGARPALLGVGVTAAVLLMLAARLPLSGYTADTGKQDSPFLQAVSQLEQRVGAGSAGLAIAAVAGLLAVAAVLAAMRPRQALGVTFLLTFLLLATSSAGAVAYDVERSGLARETFLGPDPRWIDRHGLDDVVSVLTPGNLRPASSERLFWNRSVTRLVRLPGAAAVDMFGAPLVHIRDDGGLAGGDLTRASGLLFDEYLGATELEGARLLQRTAGASLWRVEGTPRVALQTRGRYLDGWLTPVSEIRIWPAEHGPRRGVLELGFHLPAGAPVQTLRLDAPGARRVIELHPGERRSLLMPFEVRRPWTLSLRVDRPLLIQGGRLVAVELDPPKFLEQQTNRA